MRRWPIIRQPTIARSLRVSLVALEDDDAAGAPQRESAMRDSRSSIDVKSSTLASRYARARAVGRKLLWIFAIVCLLLLIAGSGKAALPAFRWAEKRVNPNSLWHMTLALAVMIPFNLGLSAPIVHQAWCVAIAFVGRPFPC